MSSAPPISMPRKEREKKRRTPLEPEAAAAVVKPWRTITVTGAPSRQRPYDYTKVPVDIS